MDDNSYPGLSEPLKTRAELKRQLLSTIPQGEELKFLERAQKDLQESRRSLQALRTERAKLMRQISIRKRKIQDWKSKIPRAGDPSHQAAEAELKRVGDAPCYAIATVESGSHGEHILVFDSTFRRGLTGLGGFEKAWVVLKGASQGTVADGLALVLVDLVRVNAADGVVEVGGLGEPANGVEVLDIKPYLAYCEAFPEDAGIADADGDTCLLVQPSRRKGQATGAA